jgi:hypothetical protein
VNPAGHVIMIRGGTFHREFTDLGNIVWICGCERLRLFVRNIWEIAGKPISTMPSFTGTCEHELGFYILEVLCVGPEGFSAETHHDKNLNTHVMFAFKKAKIL